ncbi:hypothetical protein N7517_007065 [Penicillium concentricum]|uniref:Uncharacterized protein n=1 Tax=Penicillium concentricum TaxID=293559 RepID=A0A9W9SCJ2_9EURO|nr:uncharacterized protein N7517_007065 [Penicillium concentricum]KAJ5375059.1 hypothetical protein N7517_007065 [Penicillium concentricum]
MDRRWKDPDGWGARHIYDTAPFSLWDKIERKYRPPTKGEFRWIRNKFGDGTISCYGWFICIKINNPTNQVPLTLGCMPVMFVHETLHEPFPEALYPNPRLPDPCPHLRWPRIEFSTDAESTTLLKALEPLANIRPVMYLPSLTIIELEYGDSRVYGPRSLPGIVAGRTTIYHHSESPVYKSMKSLSGEEALTVTLQEDSPQMLFEGKYIKAGSWAETDDISLGLLSLFS